MPHVFIYSPTSASSEEHQCDRPESAIPSATVVPTKDQTRRLPSVAIAALEALRPALAKGGWVNLLIRAEAGVVCASMHSSAPEVLEYLDRFEAAGYRAIKPSQAVAIEASAATWAIAEAFGLTGPSKTISAGRASSLVALGHAHDIVSTGLRRAMIVCATDPIPVESDALEVRGGELLPRARAVALVLCDDELCSEGPPIGELLAFEYVPLQGSMTSLQFVEVCKRFSSIPERMSDQFRAYLLEDSELKAFDRDGRLVGPPGFGNADLSTVGLSLVASALSLDFDPEIDSHEPLCTVVGVADFGGLAMVVLRR